MRYRTTQGSIVLMESDRLALSFDLVGSSHFKSKRECREAYNSSQSSMSAVCDTSHRDRSMILPLESSLLDTLPSLNADPYVL